MKIPPFEAFACVYIKAVFFVLIVGGTCQRTNTKCYNFVHNFYLSNYDRESVLLVNDNQFFCAAVVGKARRRDKSHSFPTRNLQKGINNKGKISPSKTNTMMSNEHLGQALILYDESKILPHHKAVRTFNIGAHEYVIQQDWAGHGVAAVVWDSAVVLGTYMDSNAHLIQGKKVLELGAGTGLAGLVAASLGADVTVTEREEAMPHLKSTVENNTVGKSWSITSLVVDWTDDHNTDSVQDYDIIIGADIIYIEETFKDLLKTLKTFAKNSNILVLISCRIRYERDEKFLNMLREYFDVTKVFFDEEKKINIFSARRKV